MTRDEIVAYGREMTARHMAAGQTEKQARASAVSLVRCLREHQAAHYADASRHMHVYVTHMRQADRMPVSE